VRGHEDRGATGGAADLEAAFVNATRTCKGPT
jgi:hypothetical protein